MRLTYMYVEAYCDRPSQRMQRVSRAVPSPNGLVLNLADDLLNLAVTRAGIAAFLRAA